MGHFIVNEKEAQRSCEGLSLMVLVAAGLEPPTNLSDSLVFHEFSLHDLLSTMQGAMPFIRIQPRKGDFLRS